MGTTRHPQMALLGDRSCARPGGEPGSDNPRQEETVNIEASKLAEFLYELIGYKHIKDVERAIARFFPALGFKFPDEAIDDWSDEDWFLVETQLASLR